MKMKREIHWDLRWKMTRMAAAIATESTVTVTHKKSTFSTDIFELV